MDMMHASDYASMSLDNIKKNMKENKMKDDKYSKGLQYVNLMFSISFRFQIFHLLHFFVIVEKKQIVRGSRRHLV